MHTENSQKSILPEEGAPLGIVWREVRGATGRVRFALLVTAGGVFLAIAVAVGDMLDGTNLLEVYRLVGLVCSALGCGALALAQVLNQMAHGGKCELWTFPVFRFNRLHPTFVATPALSTVAAILLALAIGLMAASLSESLLIALPMALMFLYLLLAVQTSSATSRFLYRHAREQADAAARAQAQAVEAQLAALQAQMNPHFLFNALNTVAALVRTRDPAAEQTVEHLAEILRRTLDRSRSSQGTVGEEIDYLRAYLAIEQQRFGERLSVQWDVDPTTLESGLPPLTVQPLVENAIKHGIGSRLEGGNVAIVVTRNNGDLRLSVSDDGVGFPPRFREGTGLGNLRQRLDTLYGEGSSLNVLTSAGGSCVTVTVPAHREHH